MPTKSHSEDEDNETSKVNIGNVSGGIRNTVITGRDFIQTFINSFNSELRYYQYRHLLLSQVKQNAKDMLDTSLHNAVLIEFGLEKTVDAVTDRPFEISYRLFDQPDHPLPSNTRIIDIYDEAKFPLLISGEPGSGKTTILHELACKIITRIEEDLSKEPLLPVVFNLSSWANRKQPISDWLIVELKTIYHIPEEVGYYWVQNDELLLLLDGFDEVKLDSRAECAEAISQFHQNHVATRLVICSRSEEHEVLAIEVSFRAGVRIQTLTKEQIDKYLSDAGPQLAALHTALQFDNILQELAKTPLMLSVMSLAYQDATVDEVANEQISTDWSRRKHIFEKYFNRMFNRDRRTPNQFYSDNEDTKEMTKHWLSWLARQMQQHHKSEFRFEYLQPNWLWTSDQFHLYLLFSKVTIGLVLGLGLAFIWGIVSLPMSLIGRQLELYLGSSWNISGFPLYFIMWAVIGVVLAIIDGVQFELTTSSRKVGLFYALALGMIIVIIIGLLSGPVEGVLGGFATLLIFNWNAEKNKGQDQLEYPSHWSESDWDFRQFWESIPKSMSRVAWKPVRQLICSTFVNLRYGLVIGIISGLLIDLFNSLIIELSGGDSGGNFPVEGLFGGLIIAVIFALKRHSGTPTDDVRSSEQLAWSWAEAMKGGFYGFAVAIIMILISIPLAATYFFVPVNASPTDYFINLRFSVSRAVVFWVGISPLLGVIGLIFGGLNDYKPVAAIKWSRKKAIKGGGLGIITSLLVAFIGGLLLGLDPSLADLGLFEGLANGFYLVTILTPILGLSGMLIGGFYIRNSRTKEITSIRNTQKQIKIVPRRGVLFMIQNALFGGLISSFIVWLTVELTFGLFAGLTYLSLGSRTIINRTFDPELITVRTTFGLVLGLVIGLIATLRYGGNDVIKYFTLRWILYYYKYIPLRFSRFLEYATDRVLLQKVGEGYIFLHPIFFEHFATLRRREGMHHRRFGVTERRFGNNKLKNEKISFRDFYHDITHTDCNFSVKRIFYSIISPSRQQLIGLLILTAIISIVFYYGRYYFYDTIAMSYYDQGITHYISDDLQEANVNFTKSIELNPEYDNAYFYRAQAYFADGDLKLAIEDLTKVLELNPDNPGAHLYRGLAYNKLGDVEASILDLGTAIEISQNDIESLKRICWIGSLWNLAKDALRACEIAVKLAPKRGDVLGGRGLARTLLGERQKAIEDFKSGLKLWEENNFAFWPWGYIEEEWIDKLENQENPFDQEKLEELRQQIDFFERRASRS